MSLEEPYTQVQLNRNRYNKWDAEATKYAFETATELYVDFHENNINHVKITSFEISKEYQAYRMHKVFIILESNGIFLYHKIYKKKGKIITTIELSHNDEFSDSDDDTDDNSDDDLNDDPK
jgi:hypothetical protein